jgi:hypothetical protein
VDAVAAPLHQRIADIKLRLDATRALRDSYRRDAFDSGKEWNRQQARIDDLLDTLYTLMLERLVEGDHT